jgi:hypothetical protein
LGLTLLLKYTGLVSAGYDEIFGYVFCGYGLIAVYILTGTGQKGGLFAAGALFIFGVSLVVPVNYEILSPMKILLPAILFAAGTGVALLFFDNYREPVFFIISAILFSAGILTVAYFDLINTIRLANKIAQVIFYYWPVIIVLIGFSILLNRSSL